MQLLEAFCYEIWDIIVTGNYVPTNEDTREHKPKMEWSGEERK